MGKTGERLMEALKRRDSRQSGDVADLTFPSLLHTIVSDDTAQ